MLVSVDISLDKGFVCWLSLDVLLELAYVPNNLLSVLSELLEDVADLGPQGENNRI